MVCRLNVVPISKYDVASFLTSRQHPPMVFSCSLVPLVQRDRTTRRRCYYSYCFINVHAFGCLSYIPPAGVLHNGFHSKGDDEMREKNIEPGKHLSSCDFQSIISFIASLTTCGKKKDLQNGIILHADILKKGLLGKSPYIGSSLVSMYAKCGALAKAEKVLEELPVRDVVSWCALITGYTRKGQGQEALICFERMQAEGILPDVTTFICILKACGNIEAFEKGQQIHKEIASKGLLQTNTVLGTALVDMYAKCGAVAKAQEVLDELHVHDVISWNALISGYVHQGQAECAFSCFERMQNDGLLPNAITFTCILKACGCMRAADKGIKIHDEIIRMGLLFEKDIVLGTALVDMYAKCGVIGKAQVAFDALLERNVVSWSALIGGLTQEGQAQEALLFFQRMLIEGVSPNAVTFISVLQACGFAGTISEGKVIHTKIVSCRLLQGSIELGNALIDMYAKCGNVAEAQKMFDKLLVRDLVTWNALISGYSMQGNGEEALHYFQRMLNDGICPDVVTFVCILKACGITGALDKGMQVHEEITNKRLLGKDAILSTALVDMYIKCGALEKAREVFDTQPVLNVVSWNALISGYALKGLSEEALTCFERMQIQGISPDSATFLSVLIACGHVGLVEEGEIYFRDMTEKFGIIPDIQHQTCMVDLFGSAGLFGKAMKVIMRMTTSDYPVWCSLLTACQKWSNVALGRLAFERAIQLEKTNSFAYISMSSIYAAAGMQEDAQRIQEMRSKCDQ